MENVRFLECLAADYERIRAVAPGNLDRQVPTCPEWTVADLLQHVGKVYLHKAAIMRDGAEPSPWPPPGLNDEEPVALLDRAYAELMEEFNRGLDAAADLAVLTLYGLDVFYQPTVTAAQARGSRPTRTRPPGSRGCSSGSSASGSATRPPSATPARCAPSSTPKPCGPSGCRSASSSAARGRAAEPSSTAAAGPTT